MKAVALGVLLLGCTEPMPMEAGSTGVVDDSWDVPRNCPPPEGVNAAPQTPEEVVALINALPKPTSLPCYLEALARPLSMYATTSAFSAQPADGVENPRMFMFTGDFVQSVASAGQGAHLLELSTFTTPTRSIKAELAFPIEDVLEPAAPYDQIRSGQGTGCGVCHLIELLSATVTTAAAYESEALQPRPDEKVSVSLAEQYARDCDPSADAQRCAILTALFAHGDVEGGNFPEATKVCVGF